MNANDVVRGGMSPATKSAMMGYCFCPTHLEIHLFNNRNRSTMSLRLFTLACIAGTMILGAFQVRLRAADYPGLVSAELIYEKAPFPQCHASTIEETSEGLVAAWFGGTHEKNPDVGIWVARHVDGKWTAPVEVANGIQYDDKRHPCWNPVLFQPKEGPLMLFYKVGPDPRTWWGMLTTSDDCGKTWSFPRRLPEGIDGPVKNKPIQLANGDILAGSSTEYDGWRIHFERTSDLGKTWHRVGPINDATKYNAIQPSILTYPDGRLQILCRSRENVVTQSWSSDGGETWTAMEKTMLPNPNSGTDAVTLADGRQLIVYNHTTRPTGNRSLLNVAVSNDGKKWMAAYVLENTPGKEFSYPAVIQAKDGMIHFTYTYHRRKVKHVVLDPAKLEARDMPDGNWPE